ncbi:unnamed protein product [Schistosoma margrebowiei]|uniref:Uncharacterized protein n=1 Tax=Schistosoma margrebowiei TaxID=48269 RepID=A0A183LWD3_9TREM|nr:unnamed protein product [Schistosoma margrebowiei]
MVVGGSRQETLYPGFVLISTRRQGVLVIVRELLLSGGFETQVQGFLSTNSNHHLIIVTKYL